MISDWQKLIERIEVQKDSLTLATETERLEFEKRTDIILPVGYKEYCQVFGQGQIGNAVIDIHIPYCYGRFQLENYTKLEKETLAFHDSDTMRNEIKLNNFRSLKKLLNSGLVFATICKSQSFFWDLNLFSGI